MTLTACDRTPNWRLQGLAGNHPSGMQFEAIDEVGIIVSVIVILFKGIRRPLEHNDITL